MSYAALIKKNVRKAFAIAGDLTISAVFSKKSSAGFDFANNTPKTPTSVSKALKGLQLNKTRAPGSKPSSSIQSSFVFNAEDVPDTTAYDTLVISSGPPAAIGNWVIVPPITTDGYLVTVSCAKEG